MNAASTARPSVVVLGGGYGGITAAKALGDVADITLVDPSRSGSIAYEHLLSHGRLVRDRAVAVDGRRVTPASGDVLTT